MWNNPLLEFVGWMNSNEIQNVSAGLHLFCILFCELNSENQITSLIPTIMPALFQMFANPDVFKFKKLR